MHLKKGVVGQFAVVSVWELKYGLKAMSSRFNWSHWGVFERRTSTGSRRFAFSDSSFCEISGNWSLLESTHLAIQIW